MKVVRVLTIPVLFLVTSRAAIAQDVSLPAPVLEWSVYILLIFAACVAIGIALFKRGRNGELDTLGGLLDKRDTRLHSVPPDVSITDCVRRMNEHKIGAMLVMDGDRLVGIFTERDAITRVLGAGLDPVDTRVSEVMTENPVCVSTTTTLEEAMVIVTTQRIRHLPVVEDGKVVAMVSSGDLTHRLIER